MNLIENIDKKIKLAFAVALCSCITSIIISIVSFTFASSMIARERKQIYVLDKNIPIVATRSNIEDNREAEYRADIAAFHEYFFSLTPDNAQIENQMKKAMNLIDASGVVQYNSLKEKGYFNNIVTSSTIINCVSDSIIIDMNTLHWRYFGKEKIDRPSMRTIRSLVTEGGMQDIPRTYNNPHGCLITNWKTLENQDISNEAKKFFNRIGMLMLSQKKETMKSEFAQHFGVLYQKPRSRIIDYIRTNPKKSFWAMILLLFTNFLLMVFIDTRGVATKKDPFKNFSDYITRTPLYHPTNGRAEPTINNIMSLREIQDSLVFYSEKANLKSHNDTVTLKRLLRKYAAVDPTIFKTK